MHPPYSDCDQLRVSRAPAEKSHQELPRVLPPPPVPRMAMMEIYWRLSGHMNGGGHVSATLARASQGCVLRGDDRLSEQRMSRLQEANCGPLVCKNRLLHKGDRRRGGL